MRKHTKEFKSSISTFGRELDSKITVLGTELILEKEDLFSITPITNSTLLKTVMKEVDFESKKQIGIGQEINVKSGVKVNGEYEYIDYGNYSVYKSEYKAETDTYSHICYDKMLKTMIDYTPLDITYPINLREYITAIATKCGLEFADKNSTFANYNTSINEDHFSNGNYTFRDVLDYIAQLVGGWLCINDNDELEIRYPELARNYDKVSGENVSFISNVEDEINTIIVDGKSTQATSTDPVSPSPDYPSEIESVGTYFSFDEETGKYGIEVKNTGKNLLENTGVSNTSNGVTFTVNDDKTILVNGNNDGTANSRFIINNYFLKAGTYILNGCPSGGSSTTYRLAIQKTSDWSILGLDTGSGSKQFTIDEATKIQVAILIQKGQTISNLLFKPMIRLSSIIDDTYEPYQSSSSLFVLDQPLRSLPNGVKDKLYVRNNKLYVERYVGSVVLDGSDDENWTLNGSKQGYGIVINDVGGNSNSSIISGGYCNCLSETIQNNIYSGRKDNVFATIGGTVHKIYVRYNSSITSIALLKEQLNSQPIIVQYELAEPYIEKIGEVDTLSTFKGVNNVSSDANIQTNMTITYPTEYEELDKHFLKDVNVSFSKKYGAVNSVVFSRGNGSDNIYRKDITSITKNGLTEIKIADNPFLEGDDRENFIQSLFDKINGLEFYIMDVASTGIMYLELGDFYYFNMVEEKPSLKSGLVKSGMRKAQGSSGGKFLCLLMNDEIKITQGLEESIYSDEPEITETDYKTASITDTSIKNAIIQTNKNSAEILLKVNSDEVVSAINLSPENIKISSAKLDIDAIATFTNSKLAEAGSTVINGANITTGSINCDRLNGGTINGQKISGSTISGGSISIQKGVYYFNMGTSTSNPNCSGLNVGTYGIKAHSDITATGFAITDSDTGKSQSVNIYDGHGHVHYLTFTGGILTKWEYK